MLLRGRRVFLVEDNPGNLAVTTILLEQAGSAVYFERWGPDACSRLLSCLPIDVILLDLMLPGGLSGYDVHDQIRAIPDLAGIPIVALTASNSATEMSKVRRNGFDGFISKPVRVNTFSKYIADIIVGEQVWAAT